MNLRGVNSNRRWAIFALTVIVFMIVIFSSSRIWLADSLAASLKPTDWMRAAKLESDNADYWYKLGLNHQWDLDNVDSGQAITYFRRAVRIDPRSATYWTELGAAYEAANQIPDAKAAFQKALEDYPASSEIHWRYGSFLLRQNEIQQGYSEIHLALQTDPRLIPLAISRVWPATQDANALLDAVLPNTEDADEQALDWFCSETLVDPAMIVWKHMISAGHTLPMKTVFPLEDILVAANRGDEARQIWRQALVANGNPAGAATGDSMLFNGGFEYDAANGGLDWHLQQMLGAGYDYDSASPHEGKRALRVVFNGSQNLSFQGVWQAIPVEPNTRYHFEGYLRTSGITTDSGVRFMINFPNAVLPPIILENFTGDHPWEVQHADFTTAPGVHLAVVTVFRVASERFDNKLAGTAWVDDVSFVPAGSSHPNP